MLWVDALCINQKDLEERSAQVRQMADIYGKAWRVVVWLGRQSCRAHNVVYTLDQLGRYPPALRIPGPAQNIHHWSSLSVDELQDWVARLRNYFDIAVLAPQSQVSRIKEMAARQREAHKLEEAEFLDKLGVCLEEAEQPRKFEAHRVELEISWNNLSKSKEET